MESIELFPLATSKNSEGDFKQVVEVFHAPVRISWYKSTFVSLESRLKGLLRKTCIESHKEEESKSPSRHIENSRATPPGGRASLSLSLFLSLSLSLWKLGRSSASHTESERKVWHI